MSAGSEPARSPSRICQTKKQPSGTYLFSSSCSASEPLRPCLCFLFCFLCADEQSVGTQNGGIVQCITVDLSAEGCDSDVGHGDRDVVGQRSGDEYTRALDHAIRQELPV